MDRLLHAGSPRERSHATVGVARDPVFRATRQPEASIRGWPSSHLLGATLPKLRVSLVDDVQRRAALATNTISRWLSVPDQRMLEDDLRGIKRLIDTEMPLTPEARLEQGQPVRVRSGPLRGMEGTVVGRKGEQRLVVAVRFLNQGASIELEDVDVERL